MVNDENRKQLGHQMQIRFPHGTDLRERLLEIAKINGRSLTAEIMKRLEISLMPEADATPSILIHDRILGDLNEKVEAALQRLDTLDDHLNLDSRPEWMKRSSKPAGKK